MISKKFWGILGVLFVVVFTLKACSDLANNSLGYDPISENGSTLLPDLGGDRFVKNPTPKGDLKLKGQNNVIDWDLIKPLLERAQQQTNEELVALFSVRDSSGSWYSYHLQPLAFSSKAMGEANGETQIFLYELEVDSIGSVPRIAAAIIPAGETAFREMKEWIMPINNQCISGSESNTKGKMSCNWVMEVPGGWACYDDHPAYGEGSCSYSPPIYDYVCDRSPGGSDSGDSNWNWPLDGGGGSTGSTGNDSEQEGHKDLCKPPLGCYEDGVPCSGNPVQNPRIAPQEVSGVNGGRQGNTRSKGTQHHSGLDVQNDYGNDWLAMYTGKVVSIGFDKDLGYYVTIQASINSTYYTIQYAHLQKDGRPSNGTSVSAGDVIGKQGYSGNLGKALDEGLTVPHSHIIVRERTGTGWSLKNDFSEINPEKVMTTKFDSNGSPVSGTDC